MPGTLSKAKNSGDQGHDEKQEDNTTTATSFRDRMTAGQSAVRKLHGLITSLDRLCRDSDPQFVKVGRDLAIVTGSVKKLTDTLHLAVSLIQDSRGEETSLKKIEELVREVFETLSEERTIIDQDAVHVRDLVQQIFKCDRIREMIDRINSLFRIVRVNIRIQSARGLSDEIFEGVSEDLENLSQSLQTITKQILRDMTHGAKSLARLQQSIAEHLKQMDSVHQQTSAVVSKAFQEIRELMRGTETMIREADARSAKVSAKVGEVVVSIQFHDSLSQRADHVTQAFDDIIDLLESSGTITDQHLGTAFVILDLQQRQLMQISREVRLIRQRIESDFLAIESEVAGLSRILHDTQFREISPQQFLGNFFSSLEMTLGRLSSLLSEGEGMIDHVEATAAETGTIVNNLKELRVNVAEIREETRVQAVNTIIMASALGQQGKTIEVLAKEIQVLSDKSGVLADDVEAMHLAVSQTIEELIGSTARKETLIGGDTLTEEIRHIKQTFGEIMDVIADLTHQIEQSAEHIRKTRLSLHFLETLQDHLDNILANLGKIRDELSPWEGMGRHESEEIIQLVQRYSMAQERMIHMFDRVDAEKDKEEEDEEIFF